MRTVLALFLDRDRAVTAIESLRTERFEMDRVRLVGGPNDVGELATATGGSTILAAGPAGPVLGGLVGSGLDERQLEDLERRVQNGAVVVLGEDLDEEAQERLGGHGAEDMLVVVAAA